MKLITSGDNQLYKAVARLKQKKYRDQKGKYIIEGPNLLSEALRNQEKIDFVIKSSACNSADWKQILQNSGEKLDILELSAELFRNLTDTEMPQGIIAVVSKRVYTEHDFFETDRPGSNLIILDRLQDPGNIGTILRTADAAGYMGAVLIKGTGDIYAPKVVRAAAGSLFRIPVLFTDSAQETLSILRRHKRTILCTTPNCDRYYYDVPMNGNIALIIGNEGNGASQELLCNSDINVKIPMNGNVESLNAAVSAGILMYESVRQRFLEN